VELVLGLTGALIGAVAVVVAQVLNARGTRKLEDQKQFRTDVAQATRSLLKTLQAQQWLVWKADSDPESLRVADFDQYNEAANEGLRSITGDLGVLSAMWPDAYDRYNPLARDIFTFDAEIAKSIVSFRRDREAGLELMKKNAERIMLYHWYVYRQVKRVVEGHKVQTYDPAVDW
jgi:hypothetical protein